MAHLWYLEEEMHCQRCYTSKAGRHKMQEQGTQGDMVALTENKVEYPLYPLKVIQKTFQNKLPHRIISKRGFIVIDNRFVGFVFGEGEALALEEAVAKYEKMECNGGPFSFGIERLWEQHREQIPGDGFLGATPKTLSVVMHSCGFQIVNLIIGVPIR